MKINQKLKRLRSKFKLYNNLIMIRLNCISIKLTIKTICIILFGKDQTKNGLLKRPFKYFKNM